MPRRRMELFLSSRSWIDPKQWFTTRECPTGHLAISGDISGCHHWGRGGLLLVSKWIETRHAAKILQGTGQPPQQRIVQGKMSVFRRLRNSDPKECYRPWNCGYHPWTALCAKIWAKHLTWTIAFHRQMILKLSHTKFSLFKATE